MILGGEKNLFGAKFFENLAAEAEAQLGIDKNSPMVIGYSSPDAF